MRAWIASGLLVAAAGGFVVWRTDLVRSPAITHKAPDPVLTCTQVEPEYQATQRAAQAAFERALAAKELKTIALEPRWIGGMMGFEKPQDVDDELGQSVAAWQQFTFTRDSQPRQAIAAETYQVDWRDRAPVELAQDIHGGVWRIERVPSAGHAKRLKVKACTWGCWGKPPPGARMPANYKREIWLLPPGSHYRGVVQIRYDAPTIDFDIEDQGCPTPA